MVRLINTINERISSSILEYRNAQMVEKNVNEKKDDPIIKDEP